MKCGMARSSRKKTVSRERRRSSSTCSLTGFSGVGWVAGRVPRVGVRIPVGQEEEIAGGLGRVAKPVGGEVAEAQRHAGQGDADEPAEEGGGEDRAARGERRPLRLLLTRAAAGIPAAAATAGRARQRGREKARRDHQKPSEGGLPAALPCRLVDLEVDRVVAGLADEAGIIVRGEVEVGEQVRRVAHVRGGEVVQPLRQAPGDEGDEPAQDRHEEHDDAPEEEPDEVGNREEQPEEDGQPRPSLIVLDYEPDRVRLHRHGYRHPCGFASFAASSSFPFVTDGNLATLTDAAGVAYPPRR